MIFDWKGLKNSVKTRRKQREVEIIAESALRPPVRTKVEPVDCMKSRLTACA